MIALCSTAKNSGKMTEMKTTCIHTFDFFWKSIFSQRQYSRRLDTIMATGWV